MKIFLESRKNVKTFIFSIVLNAPFIMKKAKFLQFFCLHKEKKGFFTFDAYLIVPKTIYRIARQKWN